MTRKPFVIAASLILAQWLAFVSPACAQAGDAETDIELDRRAAEVSGRGLRDDAQLEARRVLADFVECVVARNPRGLRDYLAAVPSTREAERLGARLVGASPLRGSRCLESGQLRFSDALLRGAVFEILFRRDYASDDLPPLLEVRIESDTPIVPAADNEAAAYWNVLNRFTNCVVRLDPGDTRSLILSEVGSAEEQAAFVALQDSLNMCLVGSAELRFSRGSLRGLLAEGLYMHAKAALTAPGPLTLADISGEAR